MSSARSSSGAAYTRSVFVQAFILALLIIQSFGDACGQEISNSVITVRSVKHANGFTGFDLLTNGDTAAIVRLSSPRVQFLAKECQVTPSGDALVFSGLFSAREGSGLKLGIEDSVTVRLRAGDPYPAIAFDLNIVSFDPAQWKSTVGQEPFHFLALYLADAEAWHQRGWLNATPLADRFPLLLDRHAGTPEISAFPYNRNWSYTPPLGANPLPVIGLWAPRAGHYVGLEFQTTRLEDNSEKDIATGYRWEEPDDNQAADAGQCVALVDPSGGQGYQQLVFPTPGTKLKSHGTLLWSHSLPATDDPNRFLWSFLWERTRDRLPRVPSAPDVAWIPGGLRRADFEGPAPGRLIGGVEPPFQVAGSKVLSGWGWHNESPTAAPARQANTNRLAELEKDARELLRYAKKFQIDGDDCVFWEKPLTGAWTPEWGGKPATTLHNANGFAAGRLFLGLYRDAARAEYLPIADGVLNWARHMAWTRNEFADVPSSPFAIGGTLSASFCLDYYMTFKESPDARRRERAAGALNLARALTYRYLVMWPSDNNRADNLDPSFLWEPNSGRDWTGAACANEVFWNLDTLAQTAVHTGDPVLLWALQGSLDRWHQLYQDVRKDSLADYHPGDMTEGYGLYAGNIYGLGARAPYGFASPLVMTEPVGNSAIRVLAGEKAALAFRKGAEAMEIADYRYNAPGNLAFTVHGARPNFDLSLTVPYVDLSQKTVALTRAGKRIELKPGEGYLRPGQALWSLYLKHLEANDRVLVGSVDETTSVLPAAPPLAQGASPIQPNPQPRALLEEAGYTPVPLPGDQEPNRSWKDLDSWAGLPAGRFWAYGVPFELAAAGNLAAVTKTARFAQTLRGVDSVYLLYNAGEGPSPALVYSDGTIHASAAPLLEALAWRAWPPIYSQRLLIARIPLKAEEEAVGVEPSGRTVWGVSTLKSSPLPQDLAALEKGAADWKRISRQEASLKALKPAIAAMPAGLVAILPPAPGGEAWGNFQRSGFVKRAVTLNGTQLVDTNVFNARRMPVAVYLDGEDYVHTVATAGDGAAALERYLKEGGTLVLLPSQPWPLFYADGPGFHRPEAITDKLGLPLQTANETNASDSLVVRMAEQTLVKTSRARFPFPAGDSRLRTIDRKRLPAGAKYTPIASVADAAGKNYGDAAGLIELAGGGRILYIACNLQHDSEESFAFIEGALRFTLKLAQPR